MTKVISGDGEFFIEKDGERVADITFEHDNNSNIVIKHTNVSKQMSGQGIGKLLISEVVKKARAENKKIIPQCSYAERQLEKNEDYHDVLQTLAD